MKKWIAKINENDDVFGGEILIGIAGGETGFEIILSNDERFWRDARDIRRRRPEKI